jgi:predicted transcriptional regulator
MATNTAPTFKQQAHALVDQLPDTATWDDMIEEARFRKAVEEGIAAANRGEFAKDEDVHSAFARWGVKT